MGQCSTLPAEAKTSTSVETRMEEQRNRLRESNRQSLDFNHLNERDRSTAHLSSPLAFTPGYEPQTREPNQSINSAVDMEFDSRDAAPSPIPLPPDSAIRTRCYKLNLDSDMVGLTHSQKHQVFLGPYSDPPPNLTFSCSEDSSAGMDSTGIAIQTAEIFRGITVSHDGTILSQNPRAMRSNRGNKAKRGEKSRQAAKIEKAKDLVDECIATGKAPDSDEPATMLSLFIMGEYDDMKILVRDGSRRLRDAEGLPDDVLFNLNHPRLAKPRVSASTSTAISVLSPRKRASPNFVQSQRSAAIHEKLQSAPPKLKSHPRDTRRSSRLRLESCRGDDWAMGLWSCGALPPGSPKEGRESNASVRESGWTPRN